jgi:hypothetical protein
MRISADEVDYEYTSLKPYVELFEKHVAAVLRDARLIKKGEFPRTSIILFVADYLALKEESMDF